MLVVVIEKRPWLASWDPNATVADNNEAARNSAKLKRVRVAHIADE